MNKENKRMLKLKELGKKLNKEQDICKMTVKVRKN